MKRLALTALLLAGAIAHAAPPSVQGCQIYPANNIWNTRIDNLPVHANSEAIKANMGAAAGSTRKVHPDWGNVVSDYYGIPYNVVPGTQPKLTVIFGPDAGDESDPGPYPIPADVERENGPTATSGDRHILLIDKDNCILYELFEAIYPVGGGNWNAYSGAIFDLKVNAPLRPDGWTSADAAGLPIFPGLVRHDETAAGEINHAIRMTAQTTRDLTYVWPARHEAGSTTNVNFPRMGERLRLRKTFVPPVNWSEKSKRIVRALQRYGVIIADNGSNFFISGTTSTSWTDAEFSQIKSIPAVEFDVVDASSLKISDDTWAARGGMAQDFSLDGRPDIVFRNTGSGASYLWRMDGATLISDSFLFSLPPEWGVEGVGDFNSDGVTDLVMRNANSGLAFVWHTNGSTVTTDEYLFTIDPVWKIEAVADFNGDFKPDFLMRNTATGNAFLWYYNGAAAIGSEFLFSIDPAWRVEAVADFSGDGQPDLLFRNAVSGLAFVWNTQRSSGVTSLAGSSAPLFSIDPVWQVVQAADWNADAEPDLLFRNSSSGTVFVWYVVNGALAGSQSITQIDPAWEIVPRR